jgi:hypothetical protein
MTYGRTKDPSFLAWKLIVDENYEQGFEGVEGSSLGGG